MASRYLNVYVVTQILKLTKYGVFSSRVLGTFSRMDKAEHFVKGQPDTVLDDNMFKDARYFICKHRVQ